MTTLCDVEFGGPEDDIPCNEQAIGITEDGLNVCENCALEEEVAGTKVYYDEEE